MSGGGGYGHVDQRIQGTKTPMGLARAGTVDLKRDTDAKIAESLKFFGQDGISLLPTVSHDLDARVRAPHSTTGIPYAISGTAKNVQVEVSQRLAGFKDPIKAILGVGVHSEQKIIIRRQYVAGGGAGIVPERAPARTVAIQEDTREVMLTRYGGDIEFNMNLLLRPELAQRELKMKLGAQEAALEQALIRIGYEAVLSQGTSLCTALVNSSNHLHNSADNGKTASIIHAKTIFGIMNKTAFPVHNLMAAAKRAAAYDISRAKKTVMILPHGLPEMLKYTKPETMVFAVSGVGKDKVDVELDGGYTDPATNCTIFTHIPPTNNDHGAANPYAQQSMLSREVVISFDTVLKKNETVHDWANPGHLADRMKTGYLKVLKTVPDDAVYRTYIKLRMMTGILGVPGSSTGELLLGYPSTSVATNAATESGRMQLRCYLGAAIYRPEEILLLEDIAFDGLVKGWTGPVESENQVSDVFGTREQREKARALNFSGSKFNIADGGLIATNTGHLGRIDDPANWEVVQGYQTYSPGPDIMPPRN